MTVTCESYAAAVLIVTREALRKMVEQNGVKPSDQVATMVLGYDSKEEAKAAYDKLSHFEGAT